MATDGTTTVIAAGPSIWSVDPAGENWTAVRPGNGGSQLHYLKGRWFLTRTGLLSESVDGLNWTTVPGISGDHLVEFAGALYSTDSDLERAWRSLDGITWAELPVTRPAGWTSNTHAAKMETFGDSILLLTTEGTLAFSNDGTTWFNAAAPPGLKNIAVGKGQVVALTSNGGLVQAGRAHPGGGAPRVDLTYPANFSVHWSGTTVEISGIALDPEGELAQVECLVDGQRVGVSTNNAFSFSFEAGEAAKLVAVVRATDSSGLVGSDEILIEVVPPEIVNLLDSEEGRSFLPDVAWVEFGGAFYAGGERAVFRSRDGVTWERVSIPIGNRSLVSMVTGNGSLVLQFSDSVLATTRDGVNWTQFRPSPWTGIRAPLRFSEGWFSGSVGSSSAGQNVSFHSQDGLRWTVSALGSGDYYEIAFTEDGVAVGLRATVFRSRDGGSNWFPIEGFGITRSHDSTLIAAEGVLVVGKQEGEIYVSTDKGETWTLNQTVDPVPEDFGEMVGSYSAGLFFLGVGEEWHHVSSDGLNWEPITGGPLQSSRVVIFGGRYLASGFEGILWSSDGASWKPVSNGPGLTARDTLTAGDGQALVVDALNAVWSTTDGMNWERVVSGRTLDYNPGASGAVHWNRFVRAFGDRLVAGGQGGVLLYSDDQGRSWEPASLNGAPFDRQWTFSDLAVGSNSLIAIGRRGSLLGSESDLFRSSDGKTWTRLRSLQTARIIDVEANGSEFVGVAGDGKIWRSIDDGETWTEQPALAAMNIKILRFDDAWIVLGRSFEDYLIDAYVSLDGLQWTDTGPIGGPDSTSATVDAAVGAGRLVVALGDRTILTAEDRQLDWVANVELVRNFSPPIVLRYQAGRFFLARLYGRIPYEAADWIEATSADGINWVPIDEPIDDPIKLPVVENQGIFVSGGGFYWSLDAINWTATSPDRSLFRGIDAELLVPLDGGFHGYTREGAEWHSEDGRSWTQLGRARSGDLENTLISHLVRFGSILVAGGTDGALLYSTDDGRTWSRGLLDGEGLPDDWDIHRIERDGGVLRAVMWGHSYELTPRVLLSTDGMTWQIEETFEELRVIDFAQEGGVWYAAGQDGSLWRSFDNWMSHQQVQVPGLVRAREVIRFAGRWIVFGAESGGDPDGYVAFSSEDGIGWSNDGVLGVTSFHYGLLFREAHGQLIFGDDRPFQVTTDGQNWAEMQPYSPYQGIQLVEVPEGLLAVTSRGSGFFGMRLLPFGASDWVEIEPLQDGVRNALSLEGRLFLVGPGFLKEWTESDLILDADPHPPVTLGVGEVLSATATLRNRGLGQLAAGDYTVEAWLSADGFFGDSNDVRVGTNTVSVSGLGPGQEAALDLEFELPENVPVGVSRLILIFDPDATIVESNRANNIAIQPEATVQVPQWELKLITNGDGEVEQDFAARFYPQGAAVSLTANAGKGSTFAGWGGDAVGGLSQVTVLMTGNLTIEANFIPIASLQVLVRGAGTVSGESDTGTYDLGQMVSLNAVTEVPGWEFAGWSGSIADTNPGLDVTVDHPHVVTAEFILPIENWRSLHFDSAELLDETLSGDGADPDGDGLSNRGEYMHGSDPRDRMSRGAGAFQIQGGFLTVVFTRLQGMQPGYELRAVGSRDLKNWRAPDLEERILDVTAGIETVEARLPLAEHMQGFLGFDYIFPQSFAGWSESQFSAEELRDELVSGDDADPDQDGLKNWQEYLHGSDPKDASSRGGLSWRQEEDFLVMRFTRRTNVESGYELRSEGSRDLRNWTASEVTESVVSDGPVETIEARIPTPGQSSGFLRPEYRRP